MSARLLKSLAEGKCLVRNNRSGQVRVYWSLNGTLKFLDVDGHATVDLLAHAPIQSLRTSNSLRSLVHAGHLVLVS